MSYAHAFDPNNKPDTCLWCGERLKTNYTKGERVEGTPKRIRGDHYGVEDYTIPTWKYINREPTGKGWEDNGFFCTLRCGEAFGVAMARNGKRLQPK